MTTYVENAHIESVEPYNESPAFHRAVLARSCSKDSKVHGLSHWRRVAEIGSELARETAGADEAVVEAFAFLHDSMRQSDGFDPRHGHRAAALAVLPTDVVNAADWWPVSE